MAGTSSGGRSNALFPGDDFSKIKPAFWLVCREAFLILLFILYVRLPLGFSQRLLQGTPDASGKALDLAAGGGLRYANKSMFAQFRVRGAQDKGPDDFVLQQLGVHDFYRSWKFYGEFIEKRRFKRALYAGDFLQFL